MKIVLIFSFCYLNGYGQQLDSDSLIRVIKLKATLFFEEKKILDQSVVKNSLDFVFITEISTKKIIGFDTAGIYRVGVLTSNTPQHLLFKERDIFYFLDIDNITETLQKVISFSQRNYLNTATIVQYLKEIIKMYEWNHDPNIGASRLN